MPEIHTSGNDQPRVSDAWAQQLHAAEQRCGREECSTCHTIRPDDVPATLHLTGTTYVPKDPIDMDRFWSFPAQ